MSSTAHIEWVRDNRGLEAAFKEACSAVRKREAEVNDWWESRFFVRRVLENGSKKLWPTTAGHVSRAYDLQDCDEGVPEFFYCDEDGQLYPVTVGQQSRCNTEDESPFVYAASDIVANGKVVGQVIYTDH